jgi:hypothetical protein
VTGAGTISEMKNLERITLFVEDLAASKKFYLEIGCTGSLQHSLPRKGSKPARAETRNGARGEA